jgi:hypothetical protein
MGVRVRTAENRDSRQYAADQQQVFEAHDVVTGNRVRGIILRSGRGMQAPVRHALEFSGYCR